MPTAVFIRSSTSRPLRARWNRGCPAPRALSSRQKLAFTRSRRTSTSSSTCIRGIRARSCWGAFRATGSSSLRSSERSRPSWPWTEEPRTPSSGFRCGAFLRSAFRFAGQTIPRGAHAGKNVANAVEPLIADADHAVEHGFQTRLRDREFVPDVVPRLGQVLRAPLLERFALLYRALHERSRPVVILAVEHLENPAQGRDHRRGYGAGSSL